MHKHNSAIWFLVSVLLMWVGRGLEAESPEPKDAPVAEIEQQPGEDRPVEVGDEGFIGHGVVVESVGKGSALEKAGLQPDDVLYRWRRLPNPPANPDEARGEIESPFDWWDVRMEQGPRGLIEMTGNRQGNLMAWKVGLGDWTSEVRPNWLGEFLSLYKRGRASIGVAAIKESAQPWLDLSNRLRRTRHPSDYYWVVSVMARAHAEVEEYEVAELILKEGSTMAPSGVARAFALNVLGIEAWKHQKLDRAALYFSEASKEIRACDNLKYAALLFNQGLIAKERGEFSLAEELLDYALQVQRAQAPGSVGEARILGGLGVLKRQQGYLSEASAYLRRSLDLEELQDPGTINLGDTLANLGTVALTRGDFTLAEVYYERALAMQEAVNGQEGSLARATILSNLGIVAQLRGDIALSESYHRRALALQKHFSPDSLAEARTLSNLGALFEARGDLAKAMVYFEKTLKIKEKIALNSLDVALALTNLAQLSMRIGESIRAIKFHERALHIRARLAPETALDDLVGLLRLARGNGELERATSLSEQAIKILDAQMEHLGSSRENEVLFRSRNQYAVLYEILSLQVWVNHPEAAFHLLERSRAQSYLAMLAERELVFSDLPPDLDGERRRLAVRYDRALQSLQDLSPVRDDAQITRIQGDLVMLRQRQQEIQVDIRERFPKLAAIQYPQPLDVAAVRQALDPGTVLLAYSVGEKETFLFNLSLENGLSVKKLAVGEAELRRKVTEFRQLLDAAAARSSLGTLRAPRLRELSRELYTFLVHPAEASLGAGQRVLLVVDGPLHLLPFATLQRSDGKYLGAWRPLHTALSATVWAELKATRRPAGGSSPAHTFSLAAFGDPHYPVFLHAEPQVAAQSIETTRNVPGDFRVRAAVETEHFDWSPLPGTRREVQEIARLFPDGSARTFLGQEATEEAAKTLGREPRIIHFAAHGHLDDRFPWNSALALSIPESPPEGRDNGLLQVWEILESVRLDADLVVLSACETGLGEELGGEGLIGLTRAFQYAGARTVLGSLWSVNDLATSELMIRFYKHLRAGLPKDQALQAAQQELTQGPIEIVNEKGERESRDFSAPYYWAGFQLYGDWQ